MACCVPGAAVIIVSGSTVAWQAFAEVGMGPYHDQPMEKDCSICKNE